MANPKCTSNECVDDAVGAYYWPGALRRLACEKHLSGVRGVAKAMGFFVVIEPLTEADERMEA